MIARALVVRALALACLVACGGGGATTSGSSKAKPVGPAVDEKTAEKDARGLATEILDTLARGNKDSMMTLLDPEMFVFGPRRGDAYNRTDALVELGKAKKKLALKGGKLDVMASSGGRSAWVVDTIMIEGEPHAVTAILVNTSDLWQVEAAIVAPTPTRFAIKTELSKDSIVPVGAVAKGKIDPGANGAVERYRKGLLDQDAWGSDLTGRTDAIVIGPGAGEVTRGKKDIKELWKTRVETRTRAVPSGDIVAKVTPDGQLAWVSSPITQVSDKGEAMPMRAFAVFEKSGGDWKLIVLHESVAIDAAGAGAAFKKVLPPAPKDEPKVAVKDKDDTKKVKSKVDDDDEDEKPKKGKKDDDTKKVKADDKAKKAEEAKAAKQAKIDDEKAKKAKIAEDAKLAKKAKADEEKAKKAQKEEDAKLAKKAKDDAAKKAKKAKADDEEEDEKPKKTAKKADDKKAKKAKAEDDEEDEKPKKGTVAKKAKKDVDDENKPYDRYPGKKRPTEPEYDENRAKKLKKKAAEDEEERQEKLKKKKEDEDEKARLAKKAKDDALAEKADKAKKKKEDEAEKVRLAKKAKEDEKAKKTKKPPKGDDEEEETPKKAKKKDADEDEDEKPKKKDDKAKKKADDKKKKEPVEEDEDRVVVD